MKPRINWMIISIILVTAFSCDEFFDINADPNNSTDASVEQLLPATQIGIGAIFGGQQVDGSGSINEDPSIFVQHYYNLNQSRYDISGSDYDANWRDMHSDVLKDIDEVIRKGTEEELWTHVGIAQVEKAYIYSTMVDLWGEVPYSEALQGQDNLNPVFENGQVIYDRLFELLDEAIVNLEKEALPVQNDIFYDGSNNNWIKLANSIKLNMYNKIRLVDENRARTGIEALLAAPSSLMNATGDDWQFNYGVNQAPENRHPLYVQNYVACCTHFPSAYLIYNMNDTDDPRLPYYFFRQSLDDPEDTDIPCDAINCSPYPNNGYFGRGYFSRVQGDDSGIPNDGTIRTIFGVYPAGGAYDIVTLDEDDEPITTRTVSIATADGAGVQPLMTHFMVLFARAEAALTLGTGEDDLELLLDAVETQINKVVLFGVAHDPDALGFQDELLNDLTGEPLGITVQEQIDDYLADVEDAYTDATTEEEKLEIIMVEKHKAMFGIGWEAFADYRRTGYPEFFNMQTKDGSLVQYPDNAREAALAPQGDFPRRLLFPALELNTNANAPLQTTKATPVFWDTNSPG